MLPCTAAHTVLLKALLDTATASQYKTICSRRLKVCIAKGQLGRKQQLNPAAAQKQRKKTEKEKTMPLGVVQDKLMVTPSFADLSQAMPHTMISHVSVLHTMISHVSVCLVKHALLSLNDQGSTKCDPKHDRGGAMQDAKDLRPSNTSLDNPDQTHCTHVTPALHKQ